MSTENRMVFVIDDDPSMRTAIKRLIETVGLRGETFRSGREFLASTLPDVPSCLVLDVRLPGLSGLELQREMAERGIQMPVIFITGYGDIPMSVRAMKSGAVEFLAKPFRDQDLLDAVEKALEGDREARRQRAELAALRQHYESLTPREREVMRLVVAGRLNKQIGAELGTTEKTIKVQRGQVMQKMRADSVAELVRMTQKLGLNSPTG